MNADLRKDILPRRGVAQVVNELGNPLDERTARERSRRKMNRMEEGDAEERTSGDPSAS